VTESNHGVYINWEALEAFLGRPLDREKTQVELMARIRGSKEFPRFLGGLQAALAEINEYGSDDLALRDLFIDVIALLKG